MTFSLGMKKYEQGMELRAQDVKAGMVVCLGVDGGASMSIQVSHVNVIKHTIRFYSPNFGIAVEYRYDQHGELYSDSGQRVYVYEFLGEKGQPGEATPPESA